jgi:hypothetical protein
MARTMDRSEAVVLADETSMSRQWRKPLRR